MIKRHAGKAKVSMYTNSCLHICCIRKGRAPRPRSTYTGTLSATYCLSKPKFELPSLNAIWGDKGKEDAQGVGCFLVCLINSTVMRVQELCINANSLSQPAPIMRQKLLDLP